MKYQIWIPSLNQNVGKPYTCVKRARRRRDALDLEYGAVRYQIKNVETKATA